MTNRNTKRKFICKRCGKKAEDLQGGFTRHDSKLGIDLIYENIDLCKKCFKKTVKEQRDVGKVQDLIKSGVLDNEDKIKKFQSDKKFRNKVIAENFQNKKGDSKARRKLLIQSLKEKEKDKIEN